MFECIECDKCHNSYNVKVWSECPICTGKIRSYAHLGAYDRDGGAKKMVKEAGAIVIRDGRVLLTRSNKKPHLWWFPKGHVEALEQPEECSVRETEEETGIICYTQKKLGEAFYNREGADYEVQYYLCHYVGEIKPKEVTRTVLWCPLELAFPILTAPNLKELLLQAIQEYE